MRTSHHHLRSGVALLVAVGLVAACGDDDDATPSASTQTTVEATTTTTGVTTSEPDATTSPSVPADLGDAPTFSETGPSGSGCSPGEGELPDGWWFGVSVTAEDGTVAFDLACYYVGAAAEAVAAERDDEVNNDVYIVNDNPALRTVPLAADAAATCVELGAGVQQVACAPSDIPDPEAPWAVWFRVVDGEVDRLVEQYAP